MIKISIETTTVWTLFFGDKMALCFCCSPFCPIDSPFRPIKRSFVCPLHFVALCLLYLLFSPSFFLLSLFFFCYFWSLTIRVTPGGEEQHTHAHMADTNKFIIRIKIGKINHIHNKDRQNPPISHTSQYRQTDKIRSGHHHNKYR